MEALLEVRNLKKHFKVASENTFKKSKQSVKGVDGINFNVFPGESLGVVGESGCGKSTMARLITQLIKPTEGSIRFKKKDLINMDSKSLRNTRKTIQMVFQDQFASLDP